MKAVSSPQRGQIAVQHLRTCIASAASMAVAMPDRLRDRSEAWAKIADPFIISVINNGLVISPHFAPVQPPVRPTPDNLSDEVKKLLRLGVIEPATRAGLVSPMFAVRKSDGGIRAIHDLRALNSTLETRHFRQETLETLRHVLPLRAYMARLDLTMAYHHIPIAPQSRHLLQFSTLGQTFQYRALPFGLCLAPWVFTRVMRCAVKELRRRRVQCIFYLDDVLIWGSSLLDTQRSVRVAVEILSSLGFSINVEKSELMPSTMMRFLGVVVDSKTMSWSPTVTRLGQVHRETHCVLKRARRGRHPTVGVLRKLVGILNFMRFGVVQACARRVHLMTCIRLALRRVGAAQFREHPQAEVRLSAQAKEELQWWSALTLKECSSPIQSPPVACEVSTDASDIGAGWVTRNMRGVIQNGSAMLPAALVGASSAARELWAAREGVRAALVRMTPLDAWSTLVLQMDSQAACGAVKRSYSRVPLMSALVRDIQLECAAAKVMLRVVFIPREQNTAADALSRLYSPLNAAMMAPGAMAKIVSQFGGDRPTQDVFAAPDNAQLASYLSWRGTKDGLPADALSTQWERVVWSFPPPALALKTMTRFRQQQQCRGMFLVLPRWEAQPVLTSIETDQDLTWSKRLLRRGDVLMKTDEHKVGEWVCYRIWKTSTRR